MAYPHGFVDLRVHRALDSSHSDDSIWPSFTDIMMVVVMIFLISSVVFMLRNVQLNQNIETATVSEQEALAATKALEEKNSLLAQIIEETKQTLAVAEHRRDQLFNLSIQQEQRISDLEYETIGLYETQTQLSAQVNQLTAQLGDMRQQRDALTDRIASMNAAFSELQDLISSKNSELAQVQNFLEEKNQQLEQVNQQLAAKINELNQLSGESATLQAVTERQAAQIALFKAGELENQQKILDQESAIEKQRQTIRELDVQSTAAATRAEHLTEVNLRQQQQLEQLNLSERDLLARLASQEQISTHLQQQNDQLTSNNAQLGQQLAELQQKYFDLTTETNRKLANFAAQEVIQNKTIEEKEKQVADLRLELADREQQILHLQNQRIADESKLRVLTASLTELELNVNELRQQEDELRKTIEMQDQQLRAVTLNTEQEMEAAQDQLTLVNVLLDQANQNEEQLQTTIAEQTVELSELQALAEQRIHALTEQISKQTAELEQAQGQEKAQLETIERQAARLVALETQKSELDQQVQSQNQTIAEAALQYQAAQAELEELKSSYQLRLAELIEMRSRYAEQTEQKQKLEDTVVRLEDEANIMLRPARSTNGRYVVEIRYERNENGDQIISYRLPNQNEFVGVNYAELEAVLSKLKLERAEGIYTKIRFPNEEHLSFGDAWRFTQDIHGKFDYYYSTP